jgi:hypothetical protein
MVVEGQITGSHRQCNRPFGISSGAKIHSTVPSKLSIHFNTFDTIISNIPSNDQPSDLVCQSFSEQTASRPQRKLLLLI